MFETETHEMELVRVDEGGTEEWHCPTCGRRFQMRWPPDYAKVVLEPGDVWATHTGGKGGLRLSPQSVMDVDAYSPLPESLAEPPASSVREPDLDEDVANLWRRLLRDIDG